MCGTIGKLSLAREESKRATICVRQIEGRIKRRIKIYKLKLAKKRRNG